MAKHILTPPRSGKTTNILASAALDCLIIVRKPFHFPFKSAANEKLISPNQILLTGSDYKSIRGKKWNKIYIDELLCFSNRELEWLEDLLQTYLKGIEVVAYSTPFERFSKEAYLLAKNKTKAFADVVMSKEEATKINREIERINRYMLNPSLNIVIKRFPENTKEWKEVRKNTELTLGKERFDVMYNLNILK